MKTERSEGKLMIKDQPGLLWFLGFLFVAVSTVFVLGPLGLFTNNHEISALTRVFSFLMGCIGVGAGLWVVERHPQITSVFNRVSGRLELTRWNLLRRSASQRELGLAEIRDVQLVEGKDIDGDPIYGIRLLLRSGEEIALSSYKTPKSLSEKVANEVRDYLGQMEEQGNQKLATPNAAPNTGSSRLAKSASG